MKERFSKEASFENNGEIPSLRESPEKRIDVNNFKTTQAHEQQETPIDPPDWTEHGASPDRKMEHQTTPGYDHMATDNVLINDAPSPDRGDSIERELEELEG